MREVDFDKIVDISDDLIEYEGFLPLLVRALIMDKWSLHLMDIGEYDEIMRKCGENKPHTMDDAVNELIMWINENKEYEYLIK